MQFIERQFIVMKIISLNINFNQIFNSLITVEAA